METRQEAAFWDTIKAFNELGILNHVMIIGSWAEYLFPSLFKTSFIPNIRTRDVDFFYRNINIPTHKIPIIDKLKEHGFIHEIDRCSEVSRFYKEDLLEIEFLTRSIGNASKLSYPIRALGIKSEGLRIINILADYACEIERNGYNLIVPEPAAYIMQKILANPTRSPISKKVKDMIAVEELLVHIKQNDYHSSKLTEIYRKLTLKQLNIAHRVVTEYHIELFKRMVDEIE